MLQRRDQYERGLRSLIERGIAEGRFHVTSARLASYSILEMGIGVSSSFRADGPMSEAQVAYEYGEFALRIVGATHDRGYHRPHR